MVRAVTRPGLIGRAAEIHQLELHACPGPAQHPVLLLLGDPGMGKTSLLTQAAHSARENGVTVLSASGTEFESQLPYAGLNRLLLPALGEISHLPPHEASALSAALGSGPRTAGTDRLMAGVALVNLLERLPQPVLLLLDDAHLLDASSQDLLAFAARRLHAGRVSILAGARGIIPPRGLGPRFPDMRLQPLTQAQATELLDAQPQPPTGRARTLVLAEAAGNPMALIELARAVAGDPTAAHSWLNEPLPLTDRLTALISEQITNLPIATREALIMVAVAERLEPDLAARVLPDHAVESLAPAETLALIKVDRTGVRFVHPLIRSAIYHGAPFGQRAAAHRQIAAVLTGQPDRQAWHLAAASLQADDDVADMLAATAGHAQRRGGAAAAAAAYERAAELTSCPAGQSRRLIAAATIAATTGQANWVQDLAARALARTSDSGLRLLARQAMGWALAWSSQHSAALSALVEVAEEAADQNVPMAWSSLATASTVAYQSGEPDAVDRVRGTLGRLEKSGRPTDGTTGGPEIDAARLWILAATGGDSGPEVRIPDAALLPALGATPLSMTGAAAWLLDESETAVALLQSAIQLLRVPELRGASGASLSALGWACLDAGRWDEALAAAEEADDLGVAYQMAVVSASSNLIKGTILAARGSQAEAHECIGRALDSDPEQCRSVTARARHALGLAALADDDYVVAFGRLRPLFGADAQPLHFHVSYLAVADLAIASARSGRGNEGRDLLGRIERSAGKSASPRLGQLLDWARAVLADPADPEPHFTKALADPCGVQWPFERARLSLDYGAWLRRHRRINEAKTSLAPALETFRRLQATPWLRKAETELRACGVPVAAAVPGAIAMLTPQQQQIVLLAARGHSNREIAQRLFLSPRTVSSHLYRCFPKLGVSSRNQLREVLGQAEPDRSTAATHPA